MGIFKSKPCQDPIVPVLKRAGFKGSQIRTAWAIVMRESGGRADLVSAEDGSPDYGLFQINERVFKNKDWWDYNKILNADYNAKIAYDVLSKQGTDWRPWGIASDGYSMDYSYYDGIWNDWQKENWIKKPFRKWWKAFPKECRKELKA